jgi:hypothetical protein
MFKKKNNGEMLRYFQGHDKVDNCFLSIITTQQQKEIYKGTFLFLIHILLNVSVFYGTFHTV